ncbi:MAG: serine hydrolase domain-containing protein [Bacteroidota bacterium]|jgi:CubicO group peptidase (beta-lactamase class C family)
MTKRKQQGSKLIIGLIALSIAFLSGTGREMQSNVKPIHLKNIGKYKPGVSSFVPDQQKVKFIDSLVTSCYKKGMFNGTILVAEKGKILYEGAFGYSNLKTKDTLNVNTPFQLASVSKMFTAAAIMLLHDKGKINYDDLVKKYLPDLPGEGITIRNLLNHRSGLQNYIYVADHYWNKSKVLVNNDIPTLFKLYKIQPIFKPGARFQYCNTNYALLALIVEKISGTSFAQFMKSNIFDPLDMKDSYIYSKATDNFIPGSAKGFSFYFRGRAFKEEIPDYLDGVTGDKDMFSSVRDMFLFDQSLYDCTILKAGTIADCFTADPNDKGKLKKYGFGWRIRVGDDDRQEVYHYGWWRGFRTYFVREMTDRFTVISLNNRSNVHINSILCKILWYPYDDTKDAKGKKHKRNAMDENEDSSEEGL